MQALLALQRKTKEEEDKWQKEALEGPNIEKELQVRVNCTWEEQFKLTCILSNTIRTVTVAFIKL